MVTKNTNKKSLIEVKQDDRTYFWDIETSTITTDDGEEMQITFLSNIVCMSTLTGEILSSTFYRTIEETIPHFKNLENCIVWCHNLDYELFHLLREIGGNAITSDKESIFGTFAQDIVLRDKNAPLQITLEEIPNITFRDSYALFNKSVATLGEELNFHKLDYDYKKIRLPWQELTQHDYDYNERDNLIVAKALFNYMQKYEYGVNDLPLTFTSQVRRARRKFISTKFGKKAINKFYFDRNDYCSSFSFFEDMMFVYQGGLTSSIIEETNKFISSATTSGVIGVDIKSSYPNQMCTKKYPFFSNDNTISLFGILANNYFKMGMYKGCIGTFKFTNIKVRNKKYILPISSSQLTKGSCSSDYKLFNGKLISASEIILPCTNIDINVINMVYSYDSIECLSIHATNKERYLRIEEVAFLLENFMNKELKKGDVGESKLIINSMYGVKVSNPLKDNYIIEDGEITTETYLDHKNIDEREEIYNNHLEKQPLFGGSLDIYSDGVFCTSFAREQLVSKVTEIVDKGGKVAYCDTDSIKFYCDTQKEQNDIICDILNSNDKKIADNKKLPRFKQFKKLNNLTDEEYNAICRLGIWEVEDKAPHLIFVTYGAKKYGYISHEGIVKTTIAGCNKKNIPIVINNFAKTNNVSLEEAFKFVLNTGVTYDTSASGRTTAQKEKRNREDIHHLTYKGQRIKQYGGIIIKDTTYTLNVSLNDSKLLKMHTENMQVVSINIKGEANFE